MRGVNLESGWLGTMNRAPQEIILRGQLEVHPALQRVFRPSQTAGFPLNTVAFLQQFPQFRVFSGRGSEVLDRRVATGAWFRASDLSGCPRLSDDAPRVQGEVEEKGNPGGQQREADDKKPLPGTRRTGRRQRRTLRGRYGIRRGANGRSRTFLAAHVTPPYFSGRVMRNSSSKAVSKS